MTEQATAYRLFLIFSIACIALFITPVKGLSVRKGGVRGFDNSKPSVSNRKKFHYTADESPEMQRFMEFLETEECEGIEATEIGHCNNLRGVFAKEAFEQGDVIVAIPFVSTLLVDDTMQDDASDVQKGLHYLQTLSDRSKWKPYFDCLPTLDYHFDATPDFWADQAIEQLQIPALIQEALDRKREIQGTCDAKPEFNAEDLQLAVWLIRSRAFTTYKAIRNAHDDNDDNSNNNQDVKVRTRTFLIPYMDFINHNSDHPNAEVKVIETAAFDESFFALVAARPIQPGKEITVSYGTGQETTLDLFSRYGFYTEYNRNDSRLDLSSAAWSTTLKEDERMLMLENSGKGCGVTATTTKGVLLALRVQLKRIEKRNSRLRG